MMTIRGWTIVICSVVLSAGSALAQRIDIADCDNTLYETSDGSLSNGAGESLIVGRTDGPTESIRRCLLHFDLSDLIGPYWYCSVHNANLQFHVSEVSNGPVTVALHQVLNDWGAGASNATGTEVDGDGSTSDDATWLHTFYDTGFWSIAGGDYDTTTSVMITIDTVGTYVIGSDVYDPQFYQLVSDVDRWVGGYQPNYGWIMIANDAPPGSYVRIDSRESTTALSRPTLMSWGLCECGDCPFPGDLDANGTYNSSDLNLTIDVLFFNGANPHDPICPITRADFNGDFVVDATDLNKLITFLFFNGIPPCDPCSPLFTLCE